MNHFEKFIKKLSQQLSQNLPGFSAQKLMAPLGRKPPQEYLNEKIVPVNSAVLILIYPDKKTFLPKIILIKRTENASIHSGQISFPGGKQDELDENLSVTALRETEEEIGVSRKFISLIGKLSPLYIPVSNYMVHPFVGSIKETPALISHEKEVKEIMEVELEQFSLEKNKTFIKKFIRIKNMEMEVPCYNLNEKIIWGATAMIISELSEIIKRMKE